MLADAAAYCSLNQHCVASNVQNMFAEPFPSEVEGSAP